jgi:hypothetical protein
MVKLIEDTSRAPEVSYLQGGRLPFGDFSITEQQKAFLYMRDILLPAEPMQYDFDPPGVTRKMGGWPSLMPATISILQVIDSVVEIKVSMQYTFSVAEELRKVAGGEVYHMNFSDLDSKEALIESNDPSVIILPKLFKALNEVVLDAPALAPYLKKETTPAATPESKAPPLPPTAEKTDSSPQEKPTEVKKPLPKENSWLWLIGLIALLSLVGLVVKRYFSKSAS